MVSSDNLSVVFFAVEINNMTRIEIATRIIVASITHPMVKAMTSKKHCEWAFECADEILKLNQATKPMEHAPAQKCKFDFISCQDQHDNHKTSCGRYFSINASGFKFCPFCGKEIE